ncbi:peptidase C15, pyroglutamyl peptidase I-like protein [Aspergillus steynii IBT 23096]|uniref:Peptidase C15, pyroglutamyl peptidase I-like protein n=1 Tax=Aspergillus steynii IBT 23096 TaxID=1392250 RepID=A0A2I2GRA6_9EURO|nr:peptidase C15, pyroglutamyl peptidase I-like protein [Aspergillus steynii IBT 23096]PLB55416.1 peptidase C15, pyroglutamyl peptidase I-like protein [Aspergillus steynii IBT 23096]
MGDYGPDVSLSKTQVPANPPRFAAEPDEISVLVTGFGPFKTNLVNASYLIASSLPPSIDLPTTDASGSVSRRVSIHTHPSPIPVAYSTVRESIPVILEDFAKNHGGRRPDIVMHMGIAAMRNFYSVETQARRDAYHMSDIKGKGGYEDGEKLWRELGLPAVLQAGRATDLKPTSADSNVQSTTEDSLQALRSSLTPCPPNDELLGLWKSFAPAGTDLRISDDAGRYLCEFIYYTSLSHAYREGHDRNVVFFHVPGACGDDAIQEGKEAAIALIKSLVTYWTDRKI